MNGNCIAFYILTYKYLNNAWETKFVYRKIGNRLSVYFDVSLQFNDWVFNINVTNLFFKGIQSVKISSEETLN